MIRSHYQLHPNVKSQDQSSFSLFFMVNSYLLVLKAPRLMHPSRRLQLLWDLLQQLLREDAQQGPCLRGRDGTGVYFSILLGDAIFCMYVCIYVCMCVYVCMYVFMYVCMYLCMSVCVCMYVYVYIYIYTLCIHTYVSFSVHVCVAIM